MIGESPAGPTPEISADPATSGDARVDAAAGALGDLDSVPVSDHVERYADVHSRLQDILNDVGSPTSAVD